MFCVNSSAPPVAMVTVGCYSNCYQGLIAVLLVATENETKSSYGIVTTNPFLTIKRVIDRNGATCRNNNHFERPTILNAP